MCFLSGRCGVSLAWVSSFAGGGGLPLYDVGSGWGTNTLAALDRDPAVRVVAVDMTHTHLTYIRQGAHSGPGGVCMTRVVGGGRRFG
jgi:precorrin-6B methylase 2